MSIELFFVITLVIFILTVLCDFRNERIPNSLLLILLFINTCFVVYSTFGEKEQKFTGKSLIYRFFIMAILFLFFFLFFSVGALGAGDIKLILICCIVQNELLNFILLVFAFGALQSLVKIIFTGTFSERLRYIKNYLVSVIVLKSILPYEQSVSHNEKTKHSIHFSLSITAAATVSFLPELMTCFPGVRWKQKFSRGTNRIWG